MDYTIISYCGQQKSRCGYCKGTNCSNVHGMHAYTIMPQDYQDLIDRGWRRSGHYCYKPLQQSTCCPCYPIRCDALNFKLSKSHKKILKRMSRFLRDGKKDKNEEEAVHGSATATAEINTVADAGIGICDEPKAPNVPIPEVNLSAIAARNPARTTASKVQVDTLQIAESAISASEGSKKSFEGNNPPCKKAKQMRLERKEAKWAAKGATPPVVIKNAEKSLSDFIGESSPDDKHKLKIVFVASNETNPTDEAFNLYRKYQLRIHNDNPQRLNPKNLQRFCYKSPLKQVKNADTPAAGYGSFHQQYWLDDELIAVGVIDVLPNCVSSVYFFYDPDYSFLSLGTYGSLREIELVQELAQTVPACHYYYMGFYIHSCPKMRYKGKLVPSFLLCPETYTWILLTDAIRAKLDAHKYQRFNVDSSAQDADKFSERDLDAVQMLVERNNLIKYGEYKQITGTEDARDMILEYGKLVGKTCAHRMLYLNF